MATDSAKLMTQVQFALRMTQRQLGALVGKDRRTVQRWQDRGCTLLPSEAEVLAKALHDEHPDLAAQVTALGDEGGTRAGVATTTMIEAIVKAAARAAGASKEAIRPALVAAFGKASEAGLSAAAVLEALRRE